jgi:hypothetical protein
MTHLIIGIFIGIILSYLILILKNYLGQKKGISYDEYKKLPLLIQVNDTLRHIIYEYGIKRNNRDFLLNILHRKNIIMQVMHRAHFPYLTKNNEITFGLALYIPISKLSDTQKKELARILDKEPVNEQHETEPFDYHVVDLGKGIKQGGYLISRIAKEVFKFELSQSDFSFELFDEGDLPYFGKNYKLEYLQINKSIRNQQVL